jgi:hypothetical protein
MQQPYTQPDSRAAEVAAPATVAALGFGHDEWRALLALRRRYRQHGDLLGARDVERLRFARWLYQTGRLLP